MSSRMRDDKLSKSLVSYGLSILVTFLKQNSCDSRGHITR